MGKLLNIIASMVPSSVKKKVRKVLYNKLADVTVKIGKNHRFINLGFAGPEKMALQEGDVADRYHIQLYHELLRGVDVDNKDVLEIGCGFGGGCYYLSNYHKPASVIGIDLSNRNIELCKKLNLAFKVKFYEMDAENIKLESEKFDVIVNLESSNSYPARDTKFCSEVVRLLKPGGYFVYGDLFPEAKFKSFVSSLTAKGMVKLSEREITNGVMSARKLMDVDSSIANKPFWIPSSMFHDFMVTTKSNAYKGMADGGLHYKLFLFKKSAEL
jgi:SAM-dependent methyltransferase